MPLDGQGFRKIIRTTWKSSHHREMRLRPQPRQITTPPLRVVDDMLWSSDPPFVIGSWVVDTLGFVEAWTDKTPDKTPDSSGIAISTAKSQAARSQVTAWV